MFYIADGKLTEQEHKQGSGHDQQVSQKLREYENLVRKFITFLLEL